MINSESSEFKQGNIPPNAYFSEEHVQNNVQWCLPSPYNKSDAYATIISPIPPCYFGWHPQAVQCLIIGKMSQKYDKIAKMLEYLIHKHFLFKTMTQTPRFHTKTAEMQAQL